MDETAKNRKNKAKKFLRLFMMDTPELNTLIRAYESDDDMLEFALEMSIEDYNITAPVISRVGWHNFPSLFLLLHGAAIQLLKSQGLKQTRNQATYNSGGSSFVRSDKGPAYQQWLINFSSEYEAKKRNYKMTVNISNGWGGVSSEFERVGYAW